MKTVYQYKSSGVRVEIDAEPGLYILGGDSATGKTRLRYLLEAASDDGEPVATIKYVNNPENNHYRVYGQLDESTKVLLVDRMDMMLDNDAVYEIIDRMKEHAVVLVVTMDYLKGTGTVRGASIKMEAHSITVHGL